MAAGRHRAVKTPMPGVLRLLRKRGRGRHAAHALIHVVLDDHSRLAYAEIHDDELAVTAAAVLRRAVAWFADRGITARRVLTDNGGCYRSRD
jgi:hypothetical protein